MDQRIPDALAAREWVCIERRAAISALSNILAGADRQWVPIERRAGDALVVEAMIAASKPQAARESGIMPSESDRLLIRQIRAGEQRAWEQLIERYEGRLLAFAIRRLRDRATCEDIVQDTFIGFLHSLANFDDKRELQTYLFTIASYKITDHLRKMGRRPAQMGEAAEERLAEQTDSHQRVASSMARSRERREL